MAEILKVIGLMSGTSLDGIDAALLETDGETVARPGPSLTVPYEPETRASLRAALDVASRMGPKSAVPETILDTERALTEAHARAVKALLDKAGLAAGDIDLVGFHGQTIFHRPDWQWTWQIGDGALLASLTGIDVVNDFRSADVAAGGQGAPLMPLYHAALARQSSQPSPLVLTNIGGVAQVTYMDGNTVIAFDTGPGNALIDDWMLAYTGKPVDQNGELARSGNVQMGILASYAEDEYFYREPPKSLDRMEFHPLLDELIAARVSPADGAATLTAFTAIAISQAVDYFPSRAKTWVITGGGRHNHFLVEQLKAFVQAPVLKAEDVGWDGDAMEAEGFAYLAVRSKKGLPLSLPTTTGVKKPMTGGRFWKA